MDLDDEELRATRIMNGANKSLGYVYKLEQRIKELEEVEQEHKKENGELRERVKELEEENKKQKQLTKLAQTITDESIKEAIIEFEKDYIPKSKIKEKIEEYKKKIIEAIEEDDDCKEIYYKQEIDILQELLER